MKVLYVLSLIYLKSLLAIAANDDEIKSLPGLPEPTKFKQYSGYLNASKGRHHFYWFVESEKDAANAPVVLWLTGGPGCSSLFAMFTENGPFRVNSDGKTLQKHDFAWNSVANILWMESPAGTGFSYEDNVAEPHNNDETTALNNYLALESFFLKYPHLKKNQFYITGESYAGVYIPMLAKQIYEHNSTINLKGLAIGNGYIHEDKLDNFGQSRYDFALGHGLLTTDTYEKLTENCCECKAGVIEHQCDFSQPANHSKCASVRQSSVSTPNPYNIYDNCAPDLSYQQLFNKYYKQAYDRIGFKVDFNNNDNKANCYHYGHSLYLNTESVRKAIHVRENSRRWEGCGGPYERVHTATQEQNTLDLINKYKIGKFIIYNGDFDTVCDFIGDQRFADKLGFTQTEKYRRWTVDGQPDGVIGGFVQHYEKGFSFVLVRGAGHMVPYDQPEAGLQLLKSLIGNTKL